ncbi:MAG: glutamine--fructose-6-phosphate transaminase [Gammaproteobacteria bacterium]|jgi:glucosamine--fructose-6-phosphate aminotransferase (isomerizing)|nr:glutamine--fructose-6-phosphate transaminase [Gammaproteobacteria bacterium]
MCGIVGAVAQRDVSPILIEGLRRLEYRGYDSAGIAVLDEHTQLQRRRSLGKVSELATSLDTTPMVGKVGIAHTRWATHGAPSEQNAHPHFSADIVALVHNGIIENYEELRAELKQAGYHFQSETDTEVVAHLLHQQISMGKTLLEAIQAIAKHLEGAYSLAIMHKNEPDHIIAVRSGSPLVLGIGIGEHFIASDQFALLPVTRQFVYLEEGDIAEIKRDSYALYDSDGQPVKREIQTTEIHYDGADKGRFRHFMQKEIFEQPEAIAATLEGRLLRDHVLEGIFGTNAKAIFAQVKQVQIVACGTSYHAGMIARYWIESIARVPCQVEIASELRYRRAVIQPNTLFVTISQSGETADTLAALRVAKQQGYLASLAICNVPESSLVRESDLVFMTRAGIEIGVASTKAFTTQLVALLLLTITLGKQQQLTREMEAALVAELNALPQQIENVLALDKSIQQLAVEFIEKHHALFLGRGVHYPIAQEGALKLKEISYIHAEAYPAGELKHGPLALIDKDMPVVTVAPNDELLEKLKSNLQEVRARGGKLYVFADGSAKLSNGEGVTIIDMPSVGKTVAPIVYNIPLQLLAYHVAELKGTDVDQPRNLAKSVTVE